MARFMHAEFVQTHHEQFSGSILSQIFESFDSLARVRQIVELGAGTGVGALPLVRHYSYLEKSKKQASMLPALE